MSDLKEYERLLNVETYRQIATLLVNDRRCRTDNWYCVKRFYRTYLNITIDKAISNKDVIQPSSVERAIRKLKQVNHSLRENNNQYLQEDKYKEIALDIPVVVKQL